MIVNYYKWCITIELAFLKELILIKQAHQKGAVFVSIGFFSIGCHDVLMMSMKLSDISILNIKSADYRCIINGISKKEAINLLKNVDLTE